WKLKSSFSERRSRSNPAGSVEGSELEKENARLRRKGWMRSTSACKWHESNLASCRSLRRMVCISRTSRVCWSDQSSCPCSEPRFWVVDCGLGAVAAEPAAAAVGGRVGFEEFLVVQRGPAAGRVVRLQLAVRYCGDGRGANS